MHKDVKQPGLAALGNGRSMTTSILPKKSKFYSMRLHIIYTYKKIDKKIKNKK